MAGAIGIDAGARLGRQQQHPQRQGFALHRQAAQRLVDFALHRVPGGEVEDLVDRARQRLERGKEHANRLAHAGRCLGHERPAVVQRRGDGGHQLRLPIGDAGVRKGQAIEHRVAALQVGALLRHPVLVVLHARAQFGFERLHRGHGGELRFATLVDVVVAQPQGQLIEPLGAAVERAIGAQLRPVQRGVIGGDAVHRPAMGLDLVEGRGVGVQTVDTPTQVQAVDHALNRHLGGIG